jgi:hypothetical protein
MKNKSFIQITIGNHENRSLKNRANRLPCLLIIMLAALFIAPTASAMYASQLDLLTDTGLDGVTNRDLIDALWPVDSIYLSLSATNPGAGGGVFAGTTWEAWGGGKVPVGVDAGDTDYDAADKTGGNKTLTLTTADPAAITPTLTMDALGRNNIPLFQLDIGNIQSYNLGQSTSSVTYHHGGGSGSQRQSAAGSSNWNRSRFSWGQDTPDAPTGTISSVDLPQLTVSAAADGTGTTDMRQPYITCYMWKRTG